MAREKQPPFVFIVDDLIRRGNLRAARRELRRAVRGRVARPIVADVAALARRAHMPALGVRLLNRLVRPPGRKVPDASDRERAVYASCLIQIGGTEEALELLDTLDAREAPETLLYRAWALVSAWDYAASIPLLEAFITSRGVAPYDALVGQVNLAAAYLHERRHDKAGKLVDKLLRATARPETRRLYANVVEHAAQNAVLAGRFREAEELLALCERARIDNDGLERFFTRKWRALLTLFREGPTRSARRDVARARAEGERLGHWETLRDFDHFLAVAAKDRKLFARVYFGTPFPAFRHRLVDDMGEPPPPTYDWRPPGGTPGRLVLDLSTGKTSAGKEALKAGHLPHRLLVALASDFYRPFRVATLHRALYPGEHFHPSTSPLRIHDGLRRLRELAAAGRLPLEIREESLEYRLAARGPIALHVGSGPAPADKHDPDLRKLAAAWPAAEFTAQEASERLDRIPRYVRRLLSRAEADGVVVRSGAGRATRYRFKPR